ncbi:MAG: MBG domain-containing protein [Pseudomonadota bacterium]
MGEYSLASAQRHRQRAPLLALLLATTALTAPGLIAPAAAQNLPTGGSIAAGSASVSQPSPSTLTINQSSQSAVVNWQSFSISQGYSVNINQPNSSSALLNRVTGSTPSTIAGSLTANGQVYLVNPNGIAITPTGTVNTGGGFVASTLGISDADFMSGKRNFSGNGASASVSNAGTITVGRGGYMALIGGTVSNSGNVQVPLGKVGLGSGEQATLDFSGDGFLQVAVPTNAKTSGALIDNAGTIKADGGAVIMQAATAREAARNAVNISGLVQARSIGGKTGAIEIGGGEGGQVAVSGKLTTASRKDKGGTITVAGRDLALRGAKLDASGKLGGGNIKVGGDRQGGGTLQRAQTTTIDAASTIKADATGAGNGGNVVVWSDVQTNFAGTISAKGGAGGGNGGEAEVSGKATLGYTGFTDLSAAKGRFGTLLLDPYNVIISNAADTSGFTATSNDSIINAGTLQTALGSANVTVTTGSGGSQAGDITVAAPVAWSSGSTLTLSAAHNIAVNAPVTLNGSGTLALSANGGVQVNKTISVTGAGTVTITAAPVPDVSTTGLTFARGASIDYGATNNGGTFKLNGTTYTLVYSLANLDAIDGVNATNGAAVATYGAGITGNYALATNLDASGIAYNQQLMGGFGGMLDGLGHTVSNMNIGGGLNNNGMIGVLFGTLSNFGMVGGSVNGNLTTGTLAGSNNGGVVQTSYSSATVYGSQDVGGLIGFNTGTIQSSFATGNVTTGGQYAGGLAGRNTGLIKTSVASGLVSAGQYVGGLVGRLESGAIQQSLFTGMVTGGGGYVGGIVGYVAPAAPRLSGNLYWDTQTSGTSVAAGYDVNGVVQATGLATADLQSGGLPSGLSSTIWGVGAGLYPYLANFYPTGPQVVSGTAYSDGGTTGLAGSSIGLIAGGANLGTISTGANGYYYFTFAPNALGNGASLLTYSNANSATLTTATGAAAQSGVNLYGQRLTAPTSATVLSNVKANVAAAAGGNAAAIAAINGTTLYDLTATGASFTVDQAINASSFAARTTTAGAPLIVSSAITIQDGGSLTLSSAGALRINAPVTMRGASTATLGYDASDPTNLTFAIGAPLTYVNADGSAATASAGGALSINGQSYQLLYTMSDLAGINNGSGNYALVNSLSPTGSYSNAVVPTFSGVFEGLGHTITGLNAGGNYAGLFGVVTGGTLRDIGLIGGSVAGGIQAGALAADVKSGSTIANAYASTSVSLTSYGGQSGGLIASLKGSMLVNSFATGDVIAGPSADVGGLIGLAYGSTVRDVFATGSVTGVTGTSLGFIGGLIGQDISGGTLTNAYATGAVAGGANAYVGTLLGAHGTVLTNGYVDTTTSGAGAAFGRITTGTGGATTLSTAQFQSGAASGLGSAFTGGTNGRYPYLKSFFPNGVQVVSGYAMQQDGVSPWQTRVSAANGGALLGSASTGVNGYYYIFAPAGSGTDINGIAAYAAGSHGAVTFQTGAVSQLTTSLNLTDGWRRDAADASVVLLSALNTAFGAAVGSTAAASLSPANREISSLAATFVMDQALSVTGTLALSMNGRVLQSANAVSAGGLLLTGGGSYLLFSAGNQVGTLAANTGALAFVNTGGLTIGSLANAAGATTGGVTTIGSVTVRTTGDLTIASDVTVKGADPALAAAGHFVNHRGSDAVTATNAGGRWLVYASSPSGNTFGGLDSGNTAIFGQTFGTLPPGGVGWSGNRYIFASTPTLTVTSTNASKTYGDDASTAIAGNYVITGYDAGVAGAYLGDSAATVVSGTASVTSTGTGVTANVAAGPYTIDVAQGTLTGRNGYTFSFVNDGRLTVTRRAITATADAKNRVYGDANPAFTYTLGGAGLVNGDTLSGSLASPATATSNVGSYAITQGSLSASSNYALTYTGATLTVMPRAITVTADAKSRIYGDANPAFTYTVGGAGLVNGDTLSGSLASSAAAASNVGGYAITQGSLAASSNYALTYSGATLTVTPRTITVTADARSRIYGDANSLSYTVGGMGLVNGDTLSGTLFTSATVTSNVGNYAITQGSLAASSNYTLAGFSGSTLTVTPRPITVTADAKTKFNGEPNPALTYAIGGAGLANGDTLTGALATTADVNSLVGNYAITQGTVAASANYRLTYVGANLVVQPLVTLNYSAIIDRILAANATPVALPVGATAIQDAPQVMTASGVATFYADPRSDRAFVCVGGMCFSVL